MLNLLTKTKPWMVASLIVATSVFGQNNASGSCAPACPPKPCPKPCPQPCPPTQMCPVDACCPAWPTPVLNAAYNYPARIQTRCPWDFYGDASFIYWQPIQENMEVGISNPTPATEVASGVYVNDVDGKWINMSFDYKPGFKLGVGGYFDHDNWDMHLEYTWFHNSNSKHATRPEGGTIYPAFEVPSFVDDLEDLFSAAYFVDSAKATWNLKMDILDLDLGRWHYVGTKFTARPSFGLRADWIRQNLSATYVRSTATGTEEDTASVKMNSRSWAIGPRVAIDTNWMIGCGFRVFGNGEADLLFTDYTHLSNKETHTLDTSLSFKTSQSSVYALRPHLGAELGFGWGTYLDCHNWYMDFALGYEFQVFYNQNVFRHYTDSLQIANAVLPNGNLYTQGLTATFKLDF